MVQSRLGDARVLFTVGYEGMSLDAFVDELLQEGVERVVDVRENPWSRKPGFTKGPLEDALDKAGISYEHVGALGTPKAVREALGEGELESFEDAYQRHLEENEEALSRLEALADEAATAIMCMERRVEDCHRRFLAQRFASVGWRIVHL